MSDEVLVLVDDGVVEVQTGNTTPSITYAVPGPKGDPGPIGPGFYSGVGPPTTDTLEDAAIGSTYLDLQTMQPYKKVSD